MQRVLRIGDVGDADALRAVLPFDEARIQRAAVGEGEDEVAVFVDRGARDAADGRFGLLGLLDLGEAVDGERRGLHRGGRAVCAELTAHDLRVDVEGQLELVEVLDRRPTFSSTIEISLT